MPVENKQFWAYLDTCVACDREVQALAGRKDPFTLLKIAAPRIKLATCLIRRVPKAYTYY